jgi:hypothetical protein
MDDFDELLALTWAAEACNAQSHRFARIYRQPPHFSTIAGEALEPVATNQIAGHIRGMEKRIEALQKSIDKWDNACNALDWVEEVVGLSQPVITIAGNTHQTAHEAARYLAEAVVCEYQQTPGNDDFDWCVNLARRLNEFFLRVPDLYGQIQGEHHAAAKLVPCPPEPAIAESSAETVVKTRQNSSPGSGDSKILSALSHHHDFHDGGCGNWEHIGGNELSRLADVSAGTVTNFWKRRFRANGRDGTIEDYRKACGQNKIGIFLALWRGETPAVDTLQFLDESHRDDA